MRWYVIKAVATVLVVAAILYGGQVWREAVCPPMQTSVAVEQLRDSDEAHTQLRTFEAKRNAVNVGIAGAVFLVVCVFWAADVARVVRPWVNGGKDVG